MSDDALTQLIVRAKTGDTAAVTVLYETYVDQVYRYIAYRVGSDADAEDLTAEVFVRMVKALPKYQDRGTPFEAWLYRIAAARVADFYRKRGRRVNVEVPENLTTDDPLPEERMVAAQEVEDLREALAQLDTEAQETLILRFVERKSHKEVADLLGKSVSAVKSIQHRALVRLAALLGSEKVRHYLRGQDD